ncbi:hypothetical protein BC938DRAFT_483085 [Jimgerdemannia flammicorona]|uniref:Glyoxylate reductase n=1 Tax=Jimgerdemannia flammicorona TaxID=994334 RepID=A0A433QCL3_9FUNG|nr:hypothetical protein BC938DRAFT_483085 [Jimgerdemannia flammicorona]
MSIPRIVVTRVLPPTSQAALEKLSNVEMVQWKEDRNMPRDLLLNSIKGADGLLCMLTDKVDQELFKVAGPKLKVVSTMSVGFDHVDTAELKQRGIKLGYTPDVLTDATADTTVMLLLAAARRLKEHQSCGGWRDLNVTCHNYPTQWREWGPNWLCAFCLMATVSRHIFSQSNFIPGVQFTSKTLGVVGLGRIGEAVAHRLRAFGISRVLYSGRGTKHEAAARLGGALHVPFHGLLAKSDFIVVCCALTEETKGMFNYDAFRRMKSSAVGSGRNRWWMVLGGEIGEGSYVMGAVGIFVNTARGGHVVQDDLARALQENLIAAAGLDVTTPEPLPTDSPLLGFKNCIVVPHIGELSHKARMFVILSNIVDLNISVSFLFCFSAVSSCAIGSATTETRDEMGHMAVANLLAGLKGETLPHAPF